MIYAVTRCAGPAWDQRLGVREQAGWEAHAAFMDALAQEGAVLLAGPLEGGPAHRALLIMDAADEAALHARLAPDPWTLDGTLVTAEVAAWQVFIGDPAASAARTPRSDR